MFGSTVYGLEPDIITIAKGVTSAYAPLSGSIVHDRVWKVLAEGADKFGLLFHGTTYSAHPICAAAGVANLRLMDQLGVVENAGSVGRYLRSALGDAFADHPMVGDVRGEGMFIGIDLVADKERRTFFDPGQKVAQAVTADMLKLGVIARPMPQADVIGLAPPLCLSSAEADIIVNAVKTAIDAAGTSLGIA
jgi:L-2,4-diaminobutyrate transaminase